LAIYGPREPLVADRRAALIAPARLMSTQAPGTAVRVLTYNVHGCVGIDGRHDPLRIARVIADCGADIVALQELDVQRGRSRGIDQPRSIAESLGMHVQFSAARECDGGSYGNAVLSRHPIEAVRGASLPQRGARWEQRALQWVRVHAAGLSLNVLNTHLGLDARERELQAAAIVGREWVEAARTLGPTVLCGDFNSSPRSIVYRQLTSELRDAQRSTAPRSGPRGTFPSLLPWLRIDHVLVSPDLAVRSCRVFASWRAKLASDHLPIVVDVAQQERPA
jgi:endonuclease/exonuclease/phosphatase family metal-dependent hydrolase